MLHCISIKNLGRVFRYLVGTAILILLLISTQYRFTDFDFNFKFSGNFFNYNTSSFQDLNGAKTSHTSQTEGEIACHLPKLNPWDPSIINHIHHKRSLTCKQIQPNMTYMDDNGYLRLNESGAAAFTKSSKITQYKCTYVTFDRAPGLDDNEVLYNPLKLLTKPVKLDEDFVLVSCEYNNKSFYLNFHAHPIEKPTRIFAKPVEDQLSVLLMYIDSISHSVLRRNLPSTFNYTSDVMNMVYFEGLNKIGDNSFPNIMAAMTGKRVYDEQEGMMNELKDRPDRRFDAWPFIWKMFAAKGYATMFNEDRPEWGVFHYAGDRGFTKKSFDYYYHMYWRAMYDHHIKNSSVYCFANEPKPRIFLDIAKRHMRMTNTKLQFMYNFYVDQSHDYVNEVERIDEDLVMFWREMYESGFLNSSVVIFASDHGHRFGEIRSTIVGLLEERLPFLGIWFPDWFYDRYPHILENMRNNSKLLASTFDIYETLKDVLETNYEGQQKSLRNRGLSLLYPLPKNRTCRDAGIPDHYCTCIQEKDVNISLPFFKRGAAILVDHLNGLLIGYEKLCRPIKLSGVTFIREMDFDEKVKKGIKNYGDARRIEEELRNASMSTDPSVQAVDKSFRFGIVTEPFAAHFEATLRAEKWNETSIIWLVLGTVSRTDSYRGLSDCITDAQLRKYCACFNAIGKSATV